MKMIKQILSICTVLGLMLVGMTSYAQAQTEFTAHLSGNSEVPSIVTSASGNVTATLNGSQLVVEGSFENLSAILLQLISTRYGRPKWWRCSSINSNH